MRFNVSQLRDWLYCQQFATYRHKYKRGVVGVSAPMLAGTMFHKVVEATLRNQPIRYATAWEEELAAEGSVFVATDFRRRWAQLKHQAIAWKPHPDWEVGDPELQLSAPLGAYTLEGTPDCPIKWNGKWWSLQFKTCHDRENIEFLGERVRLSFHEAAYQYLMEHAGYKPFGGSILVWAKALPASRIINRKRVPLTNEERLSQGLGQMNGLVRSAEEQERRILDIHRIMYDWDTNWRGPIRDTGQCWGSYKNSRCQYYDVCHNSASLDDQPFVTLEDRYAK